ncbi:helix-turn-helix domain-containing protein [Streptomyces aureocirculatus]|uniref:helix-turn-helix domain-containing protein n=1 Tax=Streptomyces aureocirculatus TaxID=67275 RepID=UPI0004CB0161|nr:helix-turn-helix transcriptional regulator [Streptomyces aureocirculatus]
MARPEKEIPTDVPLSLKSLAIDMRTLRKDSNLTISQLAKVSGYSTAAISGATAGKKVPSLELVEAFVMGCGYTGDMERWRRAHRAARRDMKGTSSSSEDTGEHQLPRLTALLRRTPEPAPPSAPAVPPQPVGLLSLVQEARECERRDKRVSSVTSADHMHTALALCTTPEDVIELMNELVTDKGLSIQELEARSRKHYHISDTTFTQVLGGTQLPTVEWLYIFLSACGLEEERTVMWHFTVTRIRISLMRQAQREVFKKSRRRRRELRDMITVIRQKKSHLYYVAMAVTVWTVITIPLAFKGVVVLPR